MLTTDLLNANAALSGLTDEQKNAIVEMSANDENTVIAKKTGEIYGGLDADILAASGIAKEGTEKTYDYAKRVIGVIKGQAGSAAELTKAKADLANVTREYTELKTKFDNSEAEHAKALFGVKLDGEFAKASAGLKFKADLPASVTGVLLEQAIAKVKGMSPEYIDDGKGGKVLAFMENGAVRRNPENNLNPFTAAELVQKELAGMGVLETGRKQTGAGTEGGKETGGGSGVVDISGARSQEEAHELIVKALLAQGKVNGSKEFEEAMQQAWKDNNDAIKALPLR